MASINRKEENFLQPLGESYFTRNQALYSALLAIKNAFSLDETRNLQKLRKRRNNATWNFARMGNKARKSRDMQAQQELSLTKKASVGLFAAWMLVAPFIPGLGPANARAGDIEEGPKLALNTKAPVMPEGSNGNTAPLFQKASHPPAQDGPPEWYQPRTSFSVGVKKLGEIKKVAADRLGHIYAAKGFSVIVYNGNEPAILNELLAGASDAKDTGLPILGVMTVDNGDGTIQTYAGQDGEAVLIGNNVNPSADNLRKDTRDVLLDGPRIVKEVISKPQMDARR